MSLPKTMEGYYQEMGRAGRDGLPSEVLLLHSSADVGVLGGFIADIEDEEYQKKAYEKLEKIKQYSYQESCRHQALSLYFDDEMSPCEKLCDNCSSPDKQRKNITEPVKMIISTIKRVNENFGKIYIIDILTGSNSQKILQNNHQKLSVYGIGKIFSKAQWKIIIDRCLELNILELGDFKTLKLTNFSREILQGAEDIDIRESHLKIKSNVKKSNTKKSSYGEVFESLRALRLEIARESNKPAYVIFDDKTLLKISQEMPSNTSEFLAIDGVGQVKIERYGQEFLELIAQLKKDGIS
jgi:ATP-dependent DNA helicase RecQ